MEGLLLLIAGLAGGLFAPVLIVAIGLIADAGFLIVPLTVPAARAIFLRGAAAAAAPKPRSRWPLRVALGASVVLLVGWILLEFVFLGRIVRAAAKRADLELSCDRVGGWLTTGHLTLSGVTARRSGGDRDRFDVRIEELEIDLRVLRLLRGEISLERVGVRGTKGRYERLGGIERPPRKPFSADVLEIRDSAIDWVLQREGKPDWKVPLSVERLEVAPFESVNAAFCVLFRGNGRGTIAGAPWAIEREGTDAGRRTHWTADGVPVELLAQFFGEPFDWMSGGTVDVRVSDAWRHGQKTEVDLRWQLVFRDLRMAVPERITGIKRKVGDAFAALANRHPKELPLEFTLTLDERGLKGRISVEGLELWDALAAGLVDELAQKAGVTKETIRDLGRAGWSKLKGWLERRARGTP